MKKQAQLNTVNPAQEAVTEFTNIVQTLAQFSNKIDELSKLDFSSIDTTAAINGFIGSVQGFVSAANTVQTSVEGLLNSMKSKQADQTALQQNQMVNQMNNPSGPQAQNAANQMNQGRTPIIPTIVPDAGIGTGQMANVASSKTRIQKMASNTFNLKTYKKAQFGDMEQPSVKVTPPLVDTEVQQTEPQSDNFQLDEFTEENPPQTEQLSQEMGQLKDGNDLKLWLENTDQISARDTVFQMVSNEEDKENAEMLIKDFYEVAETDNAKLEDAAQLWDLLPDSVKLDSPGIEDDVIEAPFVEADEHLMRLVKETEEQIKKLAQSTISPTKKTFNLKKSAQAQTTENMIMYMPNDKSMLHPQRIDPFLRQPINDWHVVERNKGFGLVLDDYWNVDWESIWRGNIMDKYSRPYRDTKTGEWVGGYIQKRFEVDKWIPEENNYQLLPGQRRKPRLPQYGIIEGRLEHMREHEAEEKGYKPTSEGKPFDWNTADRSPKLEKTASFNLSNFKKKR